MFLWVSTRHPRSFSYSFGTEKVSFVHIQTLEIGLRVSSGSASGPIPGTLLSSDPWWCSEDNVVLGICMPSALTPLWSLGPSVGKLALEYIPKNIYIQRSVLHAAFPTNQRSSLSSEWFFLFQAFSNIWDHFGNYILRQVHATGI